MAGDIQQTNSEILNTIIKLCETHADYHEVMKFYIWLKNDFWGNFDFPIFMKHRF